MSSPTSRTLELLRKEGWTAQVVERWNPHSKTRLDLFGGIDVLACKPLEGLHMISGRNVLGVQACAGASHSCRKAKLLSEKKMAIWLAAGGRLEVWSWSKRGPRGKRKTWTVRREPITFANYVARETEATG